MVESDHSDSERRNDASGPVLANDSAEPIECTQKRSREDMSEDEGLPAKKPRNLVEEIKLENIKSGAKELNGSTEEKKDTISLEPDSKSVKDESLSDQAMEEDTEKENNKEPEVENNQEKPIKKVENSEEDDEDSQEKSDTELKEKKVKESEKKDDKENTKEEENKDVEEEKDSKKRKRKGTKTKVEDSEVVEGLELSVECASDKEASSSSESEDQKEKKPKPKTIIVKAKPNDSELDVSSSEAEKSDVQETPEVVTPKQNLKKGKKRSSRTSFSKPKSSGSEDSNDDVSDEDYSPKTKKRLKKAATPKKVAKTTTESKRGRGRGRKPAAKVVEKVIEEEEDESSAEETNDKKTEDNDSDNESVENKSESESEDESSSKDAKKRKQNANNDHKKILSLKKYIRAAGIRVKNYNDLWAGHTTIAAKVQCLRDLLEKHGVTGQPTLEKCKKARKKMEKLKDAAELNTSNIIPTEGRVTRARRPKVPVKPDEKPPATPTKIREARNAFKRIQRVVDSESE